LPVIQQAAELRRRNLFAAVREAFWKQEPGVDEVLASLAALPRVFVAPLFISEGYFSDRVIPRALGFGERQGQFFPVQRRGTQELFYCKPAGTHPSMTEVLLARARGVVSQFASAPKPSETTLFIAGHGTGRSENSRKAIEQQVERIAARGLYAGVQGVFLEEAPRIGDCFDLARTRHIVVVPFFICDGLHARESIPALLGEPAELVRHQIQSGQPTWRNPTERNGKVVWYSASIGSEPRLADVVLERVREAAQLSNLKPGP
jgi:sirohydrochlorin cobaltochelatase